MPNSEEKALAGISHLAIILNLIGIVVVLIIYMFQKDKSTFVTEHAKQALGYQILVAFLSYLSGFLGVGGFFSVMVGTAMHASPNPGLIFGSVGALILLTVVISFLLIIYALIGAFKAFTGKEFQYIIIGNFIKNI